MESLTSSLNASISTMVGQDWIAKKNSYEAGFCEHLGWKEETGRYWDCVTPDGIKVELKKGMAAMWFDEIRYSEMLLGTTPESSVDTITLFLEYVKSPVPRIVRIMVIDSKHIIQALGVTRDWAECVINRFASVKRGLNCQQSMTKNDMACISSHVITPRRNIELDTPTPEQAKENRCIRMNKLAAKRM